MLIISVRISQQIKIYINISRVSNQYILDMIGLRHIYIYIYIYIYKFYYFIPTLFLLDFLYIFNDSDIFDRYILDKNIKIYININRLSNRYILNMIGLHHIYIYIYIYINLVILYQLHFCRSRFFIYF